MHLSGYFFFYFRFLFSVISFMVMLSLFFLSMTANGFGIGAAEPDGLRSKTFKGEAAS